MKETNMEHFRGEIEKLKYSFGFINGEIKSCGGCCWDCEFHPRNREGEHTVCSPYKLQWLMSEYKPEPVLTAREKHFVECIEDGWLTKGEACNEFKWWEKKPRRERNKWVAYEATQVHSILSYAFGIKLPFITWEDEEPWAVEELRKLKVEDA